MKLHGKLGNMVYKNSFYNVFKNKTVFVTGHTGFQGSWLSLWLNILGAKVIGYSLEPPTKPSLFEILRLEKDVTHIRGDIRNEKKLLNSIAEHKPQFIFHLAAQSLVQQSYKKPIETFQTNILGTANVLQSLFHVDSVNVCVIMTSDKCYENKTKNHIHIENDPMGGHDPYSASKGATELVTASYRSSFFSKTNPKNNHISIATARAGNVIGGGDWAKDRIIPDCVRSLTANKTIYVRDPSSIRPWQYVLEPLSGILWLAVKMFQEPHKFSEPWNFGPKNFGNKINVKQIVELVIREWNSGKWIDVSNNDDALYESSSLILDSSKAFNLLKWRTIYSLDESIRETILWYKKYLENKINVKEYSIQQIKNYCKKAQKMNMVWTRN